MAPSTMATTPEALATDAPTRKGSMVTSAVSRSVSPCSKEEQIRFHPAKLPANVGGQRRRVASGAGENHCAVRRRCDAARCRAIRWFVNRLFVLD